MHRLWMLPVAAWLASCEAERSADPPAANVVPASFDGADYGDEAEMVAHGERVADILGCNSCHLEDYSGANFGEMIPLIEGLWATNISQTLPELTDGELETLLREGVHPEREIYLMPSRTSQFLSQADMEALIAYLRTIAPTGERTPLPPAGFEDAVEQRLPDEYWRVQEYGRAFYPNAQEEAEFYAKYRSPSLGEALERGRYVAFATCTSCHGPGLDGHGEASGPIDGVSEYSPEEFRTLMRDSVDRDGRKVAASWGTAHEGHKLTEAELADVEAYVRALAASRAIEGDGK